MHPINHKSVNTNINPEEFNQFEKDKQFKTRFPAHCRDNQMKCEDEHRKYEETTKEPTLIRDKILDYSEAKNKEESYQYDEEILNIPIIGTELSYLYLLVENSYLKVFKKFIKNSREHLISLRPDTLSKEPSIDDVDLSSSYNNIEGKKFIQLAKGQRCDYEAFSAFNYHVKLIDKGSDENLKAEEQFSTGLMEFIIEQIGTEKVVNITVCGLVGNICVMNTVHQGLAMLEKYRDKLGDITVNFIYSTEGTLFLPVASPYIGIRIDEQEKDKVLEFLTTDLKRVADFNKLGDLKYIFRYNGTNIEINSEKYSVYYTAKHFKDKADKSYNPDIFGGSLNYKNKYLKYKSKYLELKKLSSL